jgi:hypothetical protein
MRSSTLALFGLSLGFALACGGGEKPAEPTTTPPPPPPPAAETAPAAAGGIGVAECDDYFKKVDDCLSKLDATAKSSFETSQKTMKEQWTAAASTPEGKAGLATGCKAALDAFTCPAMPATGTATGTEAGTKEPAGGTAEPANNTGGRTPPKSEGSAEGRRERPGSSTGTSSGSNSDDAGGRKARPK